MTFKTSVQGLDAYHAAYSIFVGHQAVQDAGETWITIWGRKEDE